LGTSITGSQIATISAASTSAAAAILAALPVGTATPETVAFEAEQCGAILYELASGLDSISPAQVSSIAGLAVSSLTAVQSAVNSALDSASNFEAVTVQTLSAVQVFAGLARGLSTITPTQANTIAGLAATSAGAIQAVV